MLLADLAPAMAERGFVLRRAYAQFRRTIDDTIVATIQPRYVAEAIVFRPVVGLTEARHERLRSPVLGLANIMQTIPSLALFGFLIPLPFIGGIGARTAIVALVLYSLLPIIRNTVTGIAGVLVFIAIAGLWGQCSNESSKLPATCQVKDSVVHAIKFS